MLIGQLAKRAQVSKDTIRLYESKGFIQSQPQQAGSREYRDYPEETVEMIQNIRQARLYGVTLNEWKVFHDQWSKPGLSDAERYVLLEAELQKLRQRMRDLQNFESMLVAKLEHYRRRNQ